MSSVVNIDRHKGIGGSDSGILMEESLSGIHNLWLLKTQRKEPDDLSNVLPVQMGVLTEDFNKSWFTKQTSIYAEEYPMGIVVDGFRWACSLKNLSETSFKGWDCGLDNFMAFLRFSITSCLGDGPS